MHGAQRNLNFFPNRYATDIGSHPVVHPPFTVRSRIDSMLTSRRRIVGLWCATACSVHAPLITPGRDERRAAPLSRWPTPPSDSPLLRHRACQRMSSGTTNSGRVIQRLTASAPRTSACTTAWRRMRAPGAPQPQCTQHRAARQNPVAAMIGSLRWVLDMSPSSGRSRRTRPSQAVEIQYPPPLGVSKMAVAGSSPFGRASGQPTERSVRVAVGEHLSVAVEDVVAPSVGCADHRSDGGALGTGRTEIPGIPERIDIARVGHEPIPLARSIGSHRDGRTEQPPMPGQEPANVALKAKTPPSADTM